MSFLNLTQWQPLRIDKKIMVEGIWREPEIDERLSLSSDNSYGPDISYNIINIFLYSYFMSAVI